MLSVTVCPVCSMEALRIIVCKNGSINVRCGSCFTTMFLQDLKAIASIAKIGDEMREKGNVNRVQYIDTIFSVWRSHVQEEYDALVAERNQKVMATAARKGASV